jgi:mono/diheme cytochrome c family protein
MRQRMRTHLNYELFLLAIFGGAAVSAAFVFDVASQERSLSGRELFEMNCASCHGMDGAGRSQQEVGFDIPLPDFRDCVFASREPNGDWASIIHEGGPRRAFNRMMPAFGDALSEEEIDQILVHVRTFCTDQRWPRGELNFPKALFTEKAFPEDELIWQTFVNAEGPTGITSRFVYEKRFGPRGQLEVSLPFQLADQGSSTEVGIGDIAVGWKQNLYANFDSGFIFSAGSEVVLPTGSEAKGFGKGTAIIEPFLLFGQMFPGDSFIQGHVFAEFPTGKGLDDELGWRAVVGKTWASDNGFGRAWTPMIEFLGAKELVGGAKTQWDIVPQFQVSLSQRQHVLANFGARIPLTDSGPRETQFVFYILWDWFDGPFAEGWR